MALSSCQRAARRSPHFHYAPAAKTNGAGDWRAVVNALPAQHHYLHWPYRCRPAYQGHRAPAAVGDGGSDGNGNTA